MLPSDGKQVYDSVVLYVRQCEDDSLNLFLDILTCSEFVCILTGARVNAPEFRSVLDDWSSTCSTHKIKFLRPYRQAVLLKDAISIFYSH